MEEIKSENFKEIYNRESDTIFRFCLTRVSDREQALDITQETFLRLWKEILNEKKINNEKAFLFTVARNLIIDWYRKKKSFSLDQMLEHDDMVKELPDEKISLMVGIEGQYLMEQIKNISLTYQEAVYLRFVEDLSPEEIGKILKISTNTASVRINRGIKELRKNMGYN